MATRDELTARYAAELTRLGMTPDSDLLARAVKACGPSIYRADSETVAGTDPEELARVRQNFCMKRLGISDEARIDAAVERVLDQVGRSNRNKYRAVIYYLLAQELGAGDKL